MKIGLLWFMNETKTLEESIIQVQDYYLTKYGQVADICYLHPLELEQLTTPVEEFAAQTGLTFVPSNSVLRRHLWIGVETNTVMPERKNTND